MCESLRSALLSMAGALDSSCGVVALQSCWNLLQEMPSRAVRNAVKAIERTHGAPRIEANVEVMDPGFGAVPTLFPGAEGRKAHDSPVPAPLFACRRSGMGVGLCYRRRSVEAHRRKSNGRSERHAER